MVHRLAMVPKHACTVARPGKPRPRDRIAYNSTLAPFHARFDRVRCSLPLILPSSSILVYSVLAPPRMEGIPLPRG